MASVFTTDQLQLLQSVQAHGNLVGVKLYLVGGFVRDLLLGCDLADQDIDILVDGGSSETEPSVAAYFARSLATTLNAEHKVFEKFLTAKVILNATSPVATSITELDFASARTEIYSKPGALPTVHAADLSADLKRRDFTINALALPLDANLAAPHFKDFVIDQFGGLDDLTTRVVRTLHPQSFIDDPTRAFRACRYAARLDGKLELGTEQELRKMVQSGGLDSVSRFRVLSELRHIFAEARPASVFRWLNDLGILTGIRLTTVGALAELLAQLEAVWSMPEMALVGGDTKFELGMATMQRFASASSGTEWQNLPFSRVQRRSITRLAKLSNDQLRVELAETASAA